MIDLVPDDRDDPGFISLVQRIINGAIAALRAHEIYIVQVDNWFDFKWLGWWSWKNELVVPPFSPNRVRGQRHFVQEARGTEWICHGAGKPLHVYQAGRSYLAQPITRFSKSAAFVWYSGNSQMDRAGSLMVYLSGADNYSWYVSFKNEEGWKINHECRVTRQELASFENGGRQLELACQHRA